MPLLALVLAALQLSPGDQPGHWTCLEHFGARNGSLWVTRVLDPDGRFVHEDVVWRGSKDRLPTGMTWRGDGRGTRVPVEFEAFMVWSRVPRRPVTLVIAADGVVDRRLFIPKDQLSYFRRHGWAPLQIWYSTAFPADGAVPSLHGVRQLSITAIEEGGARVGSAPLALPDWSWLEAQIASARRGLDDKARDPARHCRRAGILHVQPAPGANE